MGLIEVDLIEDLVHSSTISKGIERTMERLINELEIDSMFIIHYEEGLMLPEIVYEWDILPNRRLCPLEDYVRQIEEWYHFDDNGLFVAKATTVLSAPEKEMYQYNGYEAVVEYQMTNHGNSIGYIVIGWNRIRNLTDEEINDIHVLFKLMNEMLIREFFRETVGQNDWRLFKLASYMTGTMLYIIDEEYRLQYVNNYAKETYPNIQVGDCCYRAIRGNDTPCKDCFLKQLPENAVEEQAMVDGNMYLPYLDASFQVCATKVIMDDRQQNYVLTLRKQDELHKIKQRGIVGKNFIFSLKALYKDMIAVEIRKDIFHDLFSWEVNNSYSYSMDFVLKWLSKVHLDDKQKFVDCFDVNFLSNAYMNGEKKKEIDFRYRTHEGSYHCMNGQILFEQNTNKDIMAYILFQDVEQVRSAQIEEQRKTWESLMAARSSAELKGQILANISHDIRTPMNGIVSMVSVAKQVYKNEDRLLECLSNIDDYAAHMMHVMDSLLETVKVDPDTITIGKTPFRLDSFLNHMDVLVRESVEKKNLQFTIRSFCQYKNLLGDEIRLQQVLQYLINHAISYTPMSGSITLTAKQVASDQKRVFIRFLLDDTGKGLTEQMKESVFGFNEKSEKSIIQEEHFHLSLASHLVQLMGGQIGVKVDQKGTHLSFTLPFELQEEVQNKPERKKMTPTIGNFEGKRVLLAEDSELGQDAIRAVLEVVGFDVDTVENGKKAVIQFVSQPAFTYDAILMDVHMPFMDGREATRCIRISGKEDSGIIPIIGLMANTFEEDVKESLQAGMQAHLGKPVDVNTLYKELKKVIAEEET